MYVILPKVPLDNLVKQLTPENWKEWTGQMSHRASSVELPRMKLKNSYELDGALRALGIRRAFGPEADFSGISDRSLYLSKVVQRTFVEVNEEGTEAGAATELFVALSINDPQSEPPPFKMIVDHPFLVAICDSLTGSGLFLGAIMDPAMTQSWEQ
jgi:serpin B